jgi:SH3 domain
LGQGQAPVLSAQNRCTTIPRLTPVLGQGARVSPLSIPEDNSAEMGVRFCIMVRSYRFSSLYIRSILISDFLAARALYNYTAAIPEELGFSKGDILAVLRLQDDGWWEAEVTGTYGHPGLVPGNYLQNL